LSLLLSTAGNNTSAASSSASFYIFYSSFLLRLLLWVLHFTPFSVLFQSSLLFNGVVLAVVPIVFSDEPQNQTRREE